MGDEWVRALLKKFHLQHINAPILFEFFFAFSRCEYALKRAKSGEIGVCDTINVGQFWDAFAKEITDNSLYTPGTNAALDDAISRLLTTPPKLQVIDGSGMLAWRRDKAPAEERLDWNRIFVLIRRVRNNLFRGGKYPYPDGLIQDTARDSQLLKDSLTILYACLDWDADIARYFSEPQAI